MTDTQHAALTCWHFGGAVLRAWNKGYEGIFPDFQVKQNRAWKALSRKPSCVGGGRGDKRVKPDELLTSTRTVDWHSCPDVAEKGSSELWFSQQGGGGEMDLLPAPGSADCGPAARR